jgi:hypothetical protein
MFTSKKLLAFSVILAILTFTSVSYAADRVLAIFSTDSHDDVYLLAVSSNDQTQSLTSFTVSNVSSKGEVKSKSVPIKYFIRDGLPLYKDYDQTFAKIFSHNFSDQDGGVIVLESFYKTFSNQEKYYEFELVKDQGGWRLLYHGRPVTHIHATLGVVGVLDLIIK